MEFYLKYIEILNWFSKIYPIILFARIRRQKLRYEIEKQTEKKSKNKIEYNFDSLLNFEDIPIFIKIIRYLLLAISIVILFFLMYKKVYIVFICIAIILFAPIISMIAAAVRGDIDFIKSKEAPYLILVSLFIISLLNTPSGIYDKLKDVTSLHFNNPIVNDIYKIFIFGMFNSLLIFLMLLCIYLTIKDLGDWFFIEIAQETYNKYKVKIDQFKKSIKNFLDPIITINVIYIFKEVIIFLIIFLNVVWTVFILPIWGLLKNLFSLNNGYLTAIVLRLSMLSGLVITFLLFKYNNTISSNGIDIFELLLTVIFIPIIYSNVIRFREKVAAQIKEDKSKKES